MKKRYIYLCMYRDNISNSLKTEAYQKKADSIKCYNNLKSIHSKNYVIEEKLPDFIKVSGDEKILCHYYTGIEGGNGHAWSVYVVRKELK